MSPLRGLLSVAAAWLPWVAGHALVAWQGLELYRPMAMMQDGFSPSVLGPLLALLLGGVLLGVSAVSLLLSPLGLLTVGVAQTGLALATGFLWVRDVFRLVPDPLQSTAYPFHLFLGVWLVLGLAATGLASASWVRSRVGRREGSATRRLLSLGAVPVVLVVLLPLLQGAATNLQTFQAFSGVDLVGFGLLVVAAAMLGAVAATSGVSAVGPALSGAVLVVMALGALLSRTLVIDWAGVEISLGWSAMIASGGLLIIGVFLAVGSLCVAAAAHLPATRSADTDLPLTHRTA
ncbi:hypothetical protein ACHAAC_07490 [Aeromicrobium sp. CF4.19]|uniref:hypothetical protein n=1 Tax=Aeromicrobium sp. CF4.19 TaxID=3373082 RepID=UPI003EE519FD